jgi:aspartate aminotransferase
MSLFASIPLAPPDAILGLSDAFRQDPRPHKINLSVGVYQDETGRSPVLGSVRQAEEWILKSGNSKSYLPISGDPIYLTGTQELLFSTEREQLAPRVCSVQTPGGTGALRVAGDFMRSVAGIRDIWVSDPTWTNHFGIFQACGIQVHSYPYFDAGSNGLAFDNMLQTLQTVASGQAVLLHGCCHNPTGIDPSSTQWQKIAELCKEKNLLPVIDFAYQGFGDGLEEDALAVRIFSSMGINCLICSSFSKNFGLYQDRIGALTVICSDVMESEVVLSQLKAVVRTNYSNPPAHGAAVIATILTDESLRSLWKRELKDMCSRINTMRSRFVECAREAGVAQDFSFLKQQKGMFSYSGLTKEQVRALRENHAIYVVGSGRINVAGLTEENLPIVCEAIAQVLN